MNKKAFVLVLCAFVAVAAVTSLNRPADPPSPAASPSFTHLDPSGTCSDGSTAAAQEPAPERVPPGCCTSNCNVDKDCDRICGKGNCLCIATNSCCRRCTY